MLGLPRKGDCLSYLWGLKAKPLMFPAACHDVVAVQVCGLAAEHDGVSAKFCDSITKN